MRTIIVSCSRTYIITSTRSQKGLQSTEREAHLEYTLRLLTQFVNEQLPHYPVVPPERLRHPVEAKVSLAVHGAGRLVDARDVRNKRERREKRLKALQR